ncbi:MAG: phosphoribosylformylglycinamidine (FGAM) synthase-like enzyme [Ulvibacter sp.]|jgi:phosphoribosylformylglycinamidine (FGAM) synthase-like enzyme
MKKILLKILKSPDIASKKWVSSQYDFAVRNNTIEIEADAAIVRVEGSTKKALAISSDCTPRYVKADPFMGAMQAVVETYRNISAVGATPMAITNCLNFGNPEKPEIMGQIVKSIKGINEACKFLNYPVISGNVSLYNETDGSAINPTPTIAGVGLFKDLDKRCNLKFKNINDEIFLINNISGHISCSLYERDVLGKNSEKNPPKINLELEKKHSLFVRELIFNSKINACHDISDGGLFVTLFEMCNDHLTFDLNLKKIKPKNLTNEEFLFAEDQACYVISSKPDNKDSILNLAKEKNIKITRIGNVINDDIIINNQKIPYQELKTINNNIFSNKFSQI